MAYESKFIADTCGLTHLQYPIDKLPIKLYICKSIFEELQEGRKNKSGHGIKKDKHTILAKKYGELADFYVSRPWLVLPDMTDSSLTGISDLSAKQIAYDLYSSYGRVTAGEVSWIPFSSFGIKAGQLLLKRLHEGGRFNDNLVDFINHVALDAQRYAYLAVQRHSGFVPKPSFEADIALFATARKSEKFKHSRTFVISADRDLIHFSFFAPPTTEREVRIVRPEILLGRVLSLNEQS
jgi:hypothetical protein